MIRINLLPGKKVRRESAPPNQGTVTLIIGLAIIAVLAGGVYLFVHRPMAQEIAKKNRDNAKLTRENGVIKSRTKDYAKLKAQLVTAEEQRTAIERLEAARSVPAWLLNELSTILTPGGVPTMTEETAADVAADPNHAWLKGWDPKHVWIESFTEKEGKFSLSGGALSDADITQLALRLSASVYFTGVVPAKADETVDQDSGITYYDFNITGTVRY
ncbi:MAG TPA: PilN domain-containing protein [Kofleriaceae bacterium]|nr:PilN domain-containing protein [Kofleriaceae bacterium]